MAYFTDASRSHLARLPPHNSCSHKQGTPVESDIFTAVLTGCALFGFFKDLLHHCLCIHLLSKPKLCYKLKSGFWTLWLLFELSLCNIYVFWDWDHSWPGQIIKHLPVMDTKKFDKTILPLKTLSFKRLMGVHATVITTLWVGNNIIRITFGAIWWMREALKSNRNSSLL